MSVTGLDERALREIAGTLPGQVSARGEQGYEEARAVWNALVDRRPAAVCRCRSPHDVVEALALARRHGLAVGVRAGGHDVAGNGVCDGGLLLDLSPVHTVAVNAEARTARAEGGATWGEFDAATAAFGLATTGAQVSKVGVGGVTLGGGVGWLERLHGLSCDNLIAAEVVTADGRIVRASEDEHADLFWGLRGGGGNFGVVTSFEFRLHPLEQVLGGMVIWPAERAKDLLEFYRGWVRGYPDAVTTLVVITTAPPAPFIPEALHGAPIVAVAVCYAGADEAGADALAPLRGYGPPAVDLVQPMPYTALQTLFDESVPPGLASYWGGEWLQEPSDDAIDTIVSWCGRMTSPLTQFHINHMEGAVARVPEEATAVSHRSSPYLMNIVSVWAPTDEPDAHIAWTRGFWKAMRPFSAGGVYVNYLNDEGEERTREAYSAANWRRLAALKREWDPDNLFRCNQNIPPGT
jgi:FAD/FMN-containing dehydrogenase